MAANISGLHQFANDVGPLPLRLLDESYSTLSIALNTLSTFSNFYQDQGTTNAYTIQTTQYQFVAYSDGLQVTVRIANTNTGASTLNVNGLGAQPIVTSIGSELQPNALVAGSMVTFVYNAQRQSWQIASGGSGGGQITAPLHVTNPTGQSALSINPNGSGYLGDFNGNGLSWDANGNLTLGGNSVVAHAPFQVVNDAGQVALEINPDGNGYIGPFTSDINSNGLRWTADGTTYYFQDGALLNGIIPPFSIGNVFALNADCSGAIGCAPNQLVWDAQGHFTLTGTATLPMPPLIDLPGISITNPQNGEALVYDAANNQWVNGAPVNALATLNDVALSNPLTGQTLTYNALTQRWANSTPVLALEQLTNTHVSGPAPGQVLTYSLNPAPGWVNATIPGYTFLTNLGVGPNPAAGWVLTWDGQAWVGAAPGQVAAFPLSSLTDVGITTPLNRQVLTYDAPNAKWINAPAPSPSLATLPDVSLTAQSQGQVLAWDNTLHRWINSSLPGGSVIALDTLMDTNISDAQDNQVLTWDYASARWVNRALPAVFTPVFTNPAAGQVLSFNGTSWVNSALPPTATLATLPDVALGTLSDDVLLTYDSATSKWKAGGSAIITADAGIALTVNGLVGQQTASFVVPAGANGVGIGGAGVSGANRQFWVNNGNDFQFQINGDGTGWLGPNSVANLSWNGQGNFSIAPPSSGPALQVAAPAANGDAVIGYTSSANGLAGRFYGQAGAPHFIFLVGQQGFSNGFTVHYNGNQMEYLFQDGTVQMNPPISGSTLSVFGNSGTNVNPFLVQSLNGTNNPGLYVVLSDSPSKVQLSASGYNVPGTFSFAFAASDVIVMTSNGQVHIPQMQGSSQAGTPVWVSSDGNATLFAFTSAARFKTDVRSLQRSRVREIIAKLRSVSYRPIDDLDHTLYGLIAEEVAEVDPCLVVYREGQPFSVAYDRIAMLLLPLMQELLGMDEPEGETA